MRHVRNIYSFRRLIDSEGAAGSMRISRALILGGSAVDLALFAVLFLCLFGLTGRAFFVGGAATCLGSAFRDVINLKRHRAAAIRSS